MTLTNYWWLLIWMFTGAAFFAVFMPKREEIVLGKKEMRWTPLAAVLAVLPYIIWAGFRGDNFGDTAVYKKTFHDIPAALGQIPTYLAEHTKDKGFSALMITIKSIIGDNVIWFLFIIALFQMLCIVHLYRKYSTNYWLCIFMFVISTDYLSWMFNGIRQFLAVTIILCSFEFILKKKYIPAIAIILVASTIHGSALLMIPIMFVVQGKAWNKKTVLLLCTIVVAILFIDRFIPMLNTMLAETQYSDIVTNEIWTTDDGTNIFRVLFYSIPAILSLIGRKYIYASDNKLIHISVNFAAITCFLYILSMFSSGIYVGRLPIYTTLFGYICVPWLIDHMFTKKSTYIVNVGLVGGYLAFFYFQMHFGWGIL